MRQGVRQASLGKDIRKAGLVQDITMKGTLGRQDVAQQTGADRYGLQKSCTDFATFLPDLIKAFPHSIHLLGDPMIHNQRCNFALEIVKVVPSDIYIVTP